VWSGILGHHVNAVDVPLCLMGMKLVRTQVTPDYSDNSDDIEGYLDIFRQLVGEDMVHARLTSEYLEKKAER
jgi:pyruvate-formate lyase-activating enzyme